MGAWIGVPHHYDDLPAGRADRRSSASSSRDEQDIIPLVLEAPQRTAESRSLTPWACPAG
jgi:hypothetical protein